MYPIEYWIDKLKAMFTARPYKPYKTDFFFFTSLEICEKLNLNFGYICARI